MLTLSLGECSHQPLNPESGVGRVLRAGRQESTGVGTAETAGERRIPAMQHRRTLYRSNAGGQVLCLLEPVQVLE